MPTQRRVGGLGQYSLSVVMCGAERELVKRLFATLVDTGIFRR
jgi:hypothetical protein